MVEGLGLGVMISMLRSNQDTVDAIQNSLNKKIMSITLQSEEIILTFADYTRIKIYDDGQSCCEHRYITTDDTLSAFAGATFLGADTSDWKSKDADYEVHEVMFLNIRTSLGVITFETHNEHNGYYGGFAVCAATLSSAEF